MSEKFKSIIQASSERRFNRNQIKCLTLCLRLTHRTAVRHLHRFYENLSNCTRDIHSSIPIIDASFRKILIRYILSSFVLTLMNIVVQNLPLNFDLYFKILEIAFALITALQSCHSLDEVHKVNN